MDCCEKPELQTRAPAPCPRCGAVGRVVPEETLRALLMPDQARSLLPIGRFCRTASCEVLYYGDDGRTVEKSAVAIRVGMKETEEPIPLCYCFGVTRADVRRELAETGTCTIPARIAAEIRAGRCACEVKNPAGVCCLGEVHQAAKAEREGPGAMDQQGAGANEECSEAAACRGVSRQLARVSRIGSEAHSGVSAPKP